jgi:hypothetical protein
VATASGSVLRFPDEARVVRRPSNTTLLLDFACSELHWRAGVFDIVTPAVSHDFLRNDMSKYAQITQLLPTMREPSFSPLP